MEDHISFLVSDTGRMIRKAFDERARAVGITRPQWRVLARLKREPGMKQAPLADVLEVEPISLSRMIDRLQESGLVVRRPDPNDRRAWCLFLTKAAEPIVENMRELADGLHEDMLAGLHEDDNAALRSLLMKIRGNLQRLGNEPLPSAANG